MNIEDEIANIDELETFESNRENVIIFPNRFYLNVSFQNPTAALFPLKCFLKKKRRKIATSDLLLVPLGATTLAGLFSLQKKNGRRLHSFREAVDNNMLPTFMSLCPPERSDNPEAIPSPERSRARSKFSQRISLCNRKLMSCEKQCPPPQPLTFKISDRQTRSQIIHCTVNTVNAID